MLRYVNTEEVNVAYIDLVAIFSSFALLLAMGGALADRVWGEAKAQRPDQAHRVR